MTLTPIEQLRYCAMCPNSCRVAWPAERGAFPEAEAPSAVAFLALAVHEARIERTPDVDRALARLEVAAACRPACPHGVDLPAAVRALVAPGATSS